MQVTRLRVYPVKSFAGADVDSARVLPWGLEADRRWAVVDPEGEPVTAREAKALLGLTAEVLPDGLLLGDRDGGAEPLRVAVPGDAAPIAVGHSRQGTALPAGPDADAWLSARIGREVRLVWQPDPRVRAVNPAHGGEPGDHVSLADVGPLLLASESSLAQLDLWTDDETPALDILRFRPNVIVDGEPDDPFAEDSWPAVQLGDVRFRVSGVCDRCVMTTIDPVSLVRGKEPIRTLAKHRRRDGKTWFGVWLVPDLAASPDDAVIAVGDAVFPG
ncbi:MOSC domain-containing protein [Microbacterium sulfonylureivorans]|uniref:MOSC domain-containing protein n=1 Tax=Microbacterium sulfonylureivorans TaxID=2486854 RepID=UPI000FDBF22D|nr:MOSC N-terminal beta barrel domain-containing protein [Microbacterium sulfonylureivorans]